MREPCLDYFYGDKVKVDSFCRLPRIFVTDEFYRTIPTEIKVLYSLMLDRVAMSMRNNWREDGRVFIYFTLEEAMRRVHAGRHKVIGLFRRMETLGLIRRRKQERGKPDRIFVREFREVENWEDALLQKTYITDCITKKVQKNNGERPMYYVENHHAAIIPKEIYRRVQEEMERRSSKRKVMQKTTVNNLGYKFTEKKV